MEINLSVSIWLSHTVYMHLHFGVGPNVTDVALVLILLVVYACKKWRVFVVEMILTPADGRFTRFLPPKIILPVQGMASLPTSA